MKQSNKIEVSQRMSTSQILVKATIGIAVIFGLVLGFRFLFKSTDSKAVVFNNNNMNTNQLNTALSALNNGDTAVFTGRLLINRDLQVLKDVVMVLDGSTAELQVFSKSKLELGTNSEIHTLNGGSLTSNGKCDADAEIYFGSTLVANCDGTGTNVASFSGSSGTGSIGTSTPISAAALPVSWLDFSVVQEAGGDLQVNWSTGSEENNQYFVFQMSRDGQYWEDLFTEPTQAVGGNSQEVLEYSARYSLGELGEKVVFRLMQVDYDGKFDYSKSVLLEPGMTQDFKIATLGDRRIRIISSSQYPVPVVISNLGGEIVTRGEVDGSKEFRVDVAGIYIIEMGEPGKTKRVKQRIN